MRGPTDQHHDMDERELGQLAAMAQENMQLRGELDERKTQVRKLGVMLEALEPAAGLDAERLLDCLEGSDAPVDPRDMKIVQLAKKVGVISTSLPTYFSLDMCVMQSRNLALENNKLKEKAKKNEDAARLKESECRELQKQLELMASPAARAALMKKLAPGGASPRHSPKKTENSNEEGNKRAEKVL